MSTSDISAILGISGPLLAAIGAGLLAYDALQGPMRAHIQRKFQTRADGVQSMYRYLITTYPSPPHTAVEVSEAMAKLDKERNEALAKLQAEIAASELKYRLFVSNLAFWGFLFVATGSLAQGVAAWIAW